ncbi:hypothetical protein FACS18945_1610 [Bacteroidia bacterium]|nr:hypothetical protein FACS18945_1610 [Bacteroidia bacterium]
MVDELFITGDYRHAFNQRNDNQDDIARDVVRFIREIASSVGVNDVRHIHIIPGNHDLTRFGAETEKAENLKELQRNYDPNSGIIGNGKLPLKALLSRFKFYRLVSKHLYSGVPKAAIWKNDTLMPLHTYRCGSDFNIIYLNTAVTCNSDDERGQLVIGCNDLELALRETAKNGKPIIILAHHALDAFRTDERQMIENLLRERPQVALYLCGDAHEGRPRRINGVHELTMGCITYENDTDVVFSVGEIDLNGQLRKFNAHRWVTSKINAHGRWEAYKDFDEAVLPSGKIITLSKPERPAESFLGRDGKISDIWQALDEGKTVVLNGIGGIGKTEICRSIFRECEKNGGHGVTQVGWLTFQRDLLSTFMGQFKEIADAASNSDDYFHRAEQYLNAKGRGLLLFVDNANEISKKDLRLLCELNCRVIVTARTKITRQGDIQSIKVDELSIEDCRKLYRRHSNPDGDQAAEDDTPDETIDAIIKLADRHTLTVELLAKTRHESLRTDEDMLKELNERGFDLSEKWLGVGRGDNDEEDLFIGHMSKIFDMAGIEGEQLRVLRLFSLLAPGEIAYSHLEEWLDLPNAEAVSGLNKRGWLKREGNDVSMHPVIAAVVRKEKPVGFDEGKPLVVRLRKAMHVEYTEVFTVKLPILPHAVSVTHFFEGVEDEEIAGLLHSIAYIYSKQGGYAKALEWFYKALAICKKVLGAEHPNTATTYNNIAAIYHNQGEYAKALEWYHKDLAISEKVLGVEHPSTATTYNNIATVYDDQGEYAKALEWYYKALAIKEKVLGVEHPDTATTYNNIAGVYKDQGEYAKALDLYHKALEIYEKVLGSEHPNTATTYNNIASVYDDQGEYAKALEWYNKDLAISEKVLGVEHPDTAATYNNIASVYYYQGEYAKALEWYYKALAIHEKVLGVEHPDTATTYNNIAFLYYNQGEYIQALDWHNKTLAIREKVLSTEHPSTATTYNNIAFVYRNQGDYDKARDLFCRAYIVRNKRGLSGHPDTIDTFESMRDSYLQAGGEEENFAAWFAERQSTYRNGANKIYGARSYSRRECDEMD